MIEPWEQGEFASFRSIAAVLAYLASKEGLDGVRKVLMQADLRREPLIEAAGTLAALGLVDLAKLIRQHARKAKPTPIDELPFERRMAARRR